MTPARININNPRWQRAVQVLNRMDPYRRKIFDTVLADTKFADEEMRSYLMGADMAARRLAQERSLESGEKRLDYGLKRADANYNIADQTYDFNKSEADEAYNLGLLSLPVQGLSGLADYKNKKTEVKRNKYLAGLYRG